MNKKLKELARQAKPSPNLIWSDAEIEHFAELVRQDEREACARELRELKPVAWAAPSIYGGFEGLSFDKSSRFDTPLYALEKDHGFDRTASHMAGAYVDTAQSEKLKDE